MTTERDDGGGTPGTSADPETYAEGDTDQLELDDMLLERGVGDLLDEGYSPPEHQSNRHRLETDLDQELGEPLDERLAAEEPEVWDTDPGPDVGAREPDRAGRLTAAEPDATGWWPTADTTAVDVGVAGGAASAEEAAMHLIGEEDEAVHDEIETAEELGDEDEQV